MPVNKNALTRYHALDKCFSSRTRRFYIEDLVEACNDAIYEFTGKYESIKKRQVYLDIKFMESEEGYGIDLVRERDGHKIFMYYADRNFSIKNSPINEQEALALKEAIAALARFEGQSFSWINEVSLKLKTEFKLEEQSKKIIQYEENPYLEGKHHLQALYNAIHNKRVLKCEYQSFKYEDATMYHFSPAFLKQYNNRWFCFGRTEETDILMNLALDRIVNLEETDRSYIESQEDFSEYFEDIVGVTLPQESNNEEVLIRVQNKLWPYIKTKPLHGSQKLVYEGVDYTDIKLNLIPNPEFFGLMFSFGERGIEILEPQHLRLEFIKRIKKLKEHYSDS